MIDTGTVTREFFESLIGGVFTLETRPVVELKLVEAVASGARLEGAVREPFRLEFAGPAGLRMPQRIYRMEHPATGAIELFLVQTGDGPEGSRIEAVFS